MFKPSDKSVNMSHLQTQVGPFTPNELVDAVGDDHLGVGDKVTMEWHFEAENGNVVTLYDYKADAIDHPTVRILWSVGGHDNLTAIRFAEWLTEKVGDPVSSFDPCWDNIPGGF